MITFSNLAQDLQISPHTVKSWLNIIEKMYLAFSISPYTKKILRAITKPPKVYFYDNADVINHNGSRFENLVATTLLKRLQFIEDFHGYRCSLHYIRDKEGREVDFVTVIDGKVVDLIEAKYNDNSVSPSLQYYANLLKPQRAVQLVSELKQPFHQNGIYITNPIDFFINPPWEAISS